jgi:hypothetical protein
LKNSIQIESIAPNAPGEPPGGLSLTRLAESRRRLADLKNEISSVNRELISSEMERVERETDELEGEFESLRIRELGLNDMEGDNLRNSLKIFQIENVSSKSSSSGAELRRTLWERTADLERLERGDEEKEETIREISNKYEKYEKEMKKIKLKLEKLK